MMEKFLKFLHGYVQICVSGEQLERFLNLIKNHAIHLEKICCQGEDCLTAFVSLKDFFRLRSVRNKTKVHIVVLKRRGLPFFFYRNKKRKAFFIGVLLSLFLLFLLSGRIWNIHIEGNEKNTTPEILEFLEKEGITHGMEKSGINCQKIASLLRREYPDVAWVSARIQGTRLILTVQEGILQNLDASEETPCNLIADKEGTITNMITRQGVPLVHPGDECKKGDFLVSGELPVVNDSKEVIRYHYVKADADIYVRHKLFYYFALPLSHTEKIYTGEAKKSFYLRLGRWYLGMNPKWKENQELLTKEQDFFLTENFRLPISLGICETRTYSKKKMAYTPVQAKELAERHLQLFQKKLLDEGAVIESQSIKTKADKNTFISEGFMWVIEKTGSPSPVEQREVSPTPQISENESG